MYGLFHVFISVGQVQLPFGSINTFIISTRFYELQALPKNPKDNLALNLALNLDQNYHKKGG